MSQQLRQYNGLPQNPEPLLSGKLTSRVWYFFFQGLWKGAPPSAESLITPSASPFTYIAPSRGFLIVSGGTVVAVQYSRDGLSNYLTGQTSGCFPLSQGDRLIVIYSAAPTLTWVPQ